MSGLIVVGVGPGIGRSVARRFAREGMPLSLVARNQTTLAAIAAELTPFAVPVTLHRADAARTDDLQDAVRASIAERGVPDVVVYNAGLIQSDVPGELTAGQQTVAWSVNVLGALTVAVATMPLMADRGSGTFLITGGLPVPVSSQFSLSLGKAGVRAMTAMLADYYGRRGVHAATITIGGAVGAGTAFDPDDIAEHYWRLHTQAPEHWQTEWLYDGPS